MAYKPAARELARQVLADPVALRLRWEESARVRSGQNVRALLAKAAEYRQKWREYEEALAKWTPPPESAAQESGDQDEDAKEGEEKKDEKASDEGEKKDEDEKKDAEKEKEKEKDDSKSKKKKKGEPEELEPDPITGVWEAELAPAKTPLRLRAKLAKPGESAALEGNLRCDALSSTLIDVEGWFDREKRTVSVSGLGSRGWVELTAELKEGKLAGEARVAGEAHAATLARVSKDYVVARRSERGTTKDETPKEPKGKPKAPKRDEKLEPLRRAMEGEAALVIEVDRAADVVACVEACARVGIRPVLYGALEAHLVLDEIAGRVAGVLLSPQVVVSFGEPERGTDYRTPYSDLQNAGIPVAFQSEAEEGAIDLPLRAAFAVANGMSPEGALRALTADAAAMLAIDERVGRLARGRAGSTSTCSCWMVHRSTRRRASCARG
jgi:hypothetical protein